MAIARRVAWVALPSDLGRAPHQADKAVCFGWDVQPDREVADAAAKGWAKGSAEGSAKGWAKGSAEAAFGDPASWCCKCRLFFDGLAPGGLLGSETGPEALGRGTGPEALGLRPGPGVVLAELQHVFRTGDAVWLSEWSVASSFMASYEKRPESVGSLFRPGSYRYEVCPEGVTRTRMKFDALVHSEEPIRDSDRRARDASIAVFGFLDHWLARPGVTVLLVDDYHHLQPARAAPDIIGAIVKAVSFWIPPISFWMSGYLVGMYMSGP